PLTRKAAAWEPVSLGRALAAVAPAGPEALLHEAEVLLRLRAGGRVLREVGVGREIVGQEAGDPVPGERVLRRRTRGLVDDLGPRDSPHRRHVRAAHDGD